MSRSEEEIPDATTAAGQPARGEDHSAIATIAGHDQRLMRRLRADLAVIARRTDDESLRDLCRAVLRGTQSVRRVFEHPAFSAMVGRSVDQLQRGLDRLDPDDRDRLLADAGSSDLSEERQFALMEGRRPPEEQIGRAHV